MRANGARRRSGRTRRTPVEQHLVHVDALSVQQVLAQLQMVEGRRRVEGGCGRTWLVLQGRRERCPETPAELGGALQHAAGVRLVDEATPVRPEVEQESRPEPNRAVPDSEQVLNTLQG